MADGYGAVPQHEHIVYIKAGSDSRRPRTPVLAILFATAAVAAVAAVTILGQPQGSASSGNLVELLGADGVRQFAQYTGLSEQGAVSMLETTLIGVGAGPPGGNVDNLDVSTNIAKADKYLGTDSDEAKLMTHIEGGVVTAAPAESFFDPDANVRQDNVCGKRDEINEKLTELLNKLRVSLLPANRTVVSLADAYIAAQETYLLTESNYRDAVEQKGASCGGLPNAVTTDATAKDAHADATQVLTSTKATAGDEIASVKSEKEMILMLLQMIGTLHDTKKTEGVNIGTDSTGKDVNGISDIMAKATPAQLAATFTTIKKLSLRINSPALATKLQEFNPTMLAEYKESSKVTEILKTLLLELESRQTALEAEIEGATANAATAADAAQTATLALVNVGEACDTAKAEELTNDTARGPAKGDAQSAKDAYVLGKVSWTNTKTSLSREVCIIKQIMIKLNSNCEGREDTSVSLSTCEATPVA